MKEKFKLYLNSHFEKVKEYYESCKEDGDWVNGFNSILNSKTLRSALNEDEYLKIYQAYLCATVNTDYNYHDKLLSDLYKHCVTSSDNVLLNIMKNLRFVLDSENDKERNDNLEECLDNLFSHLYKQEITEIKKAIEFIRNETTKCSPILLFIIDIIKLLNSILENEPQIWNLMISKLENIDFDKEEIYSYITEMFALLLASYGDDEIWADVIIKLFIKSLSIKEPEEQATAFSFCAAAALFFKDYQLCYDVCFSWLNKKAVGKIFSIPIFFGNQNPDLQQDEPFCADMIKELMAHTCVTIYRMLPKCSEQAELFLNEALIYSKKLVDSDDQDSSHLKIYAEILYEAKKLNEALEQMWLCYKKTEKDEDRLIRLKNCIDIKLELLCQTEDIKKIFENFSEENNSIEEKPLLIKTIEALLYLYNSVTDFKKKKELSSTEKDAVDQSKHFIEILNAIENLNFENSSDCSQEITYILLCICNTVKLIRQQLRYKSESKQKFFFRNHFDDELINDTETQKLNIKEKIAYYTTLDNLKFLFNKLYQDTNEDKPHIIDLKKDNIDNKIKEGAKNCLTMMHAYYMNDPNEGLTLLNELSKTIDSENNYPNLLFRKLPPALFREQLYDGQFVFMKSFTNLIDQLNMWSMYASDRKQNTDSNGCCVCIAPETFDMMDPAPNPAELFFEAGNAQLRTTQNDYHLYKVAYIDNGNIINENKQLTNNYNKLKKLFVILNETLCTQKLNSDENMEVIHRVLQKILSPIIFLFKDASYRAEQECRIVIHKDKDELDSIGTTSQNPPKLYINPYHQIFVEELILGPKVESPDQWIPYLQYELTKMWGTWSKSLYGTRSPVVRKSNINYRD